jgi:hypothetical protein
MMAVKLTARMMFIPCDRMVVDHLSNEVETGRNDYPIMLNSSQQLRNDTSSQQIATMHKGAQQSSTGHKFTQGDKTGAQQISTGGETDAQRDS